MGILDKIAEIEHEISRTQKNKGKYSLLILYNVYYDTMLNSKYLYQKHFLIYQNSLLATNYHLGTLKAKLAKYRSELLEPTGKKGESGEGFEVLKSGDARVAMIGFPSVGKVSFIFSLYYTSFTYSTETLFKNIFSVYITQQHYQDRK